jgi:RNA polymerase sigma factor (sigma-70 family)
MNITAITRYKHGDLYNLLKQLGWTQAELARRTGMHACTLGGIINLARRPTVDQADRIQRALGEAGVYLDVLSTWPETFAGLKPGYKVEQTADIDMGTLVGCHEALMIAAPEPVDTTDIDAAVEEAVSRLDPDHRTVIQRHFMNEETLKEIGDDLHLSPSGVGQRGVQALRKLRRPEVLGTLESHYAGAS